MDTSFWHPFADMSRVPGNELIFARGDGAWLYDDADRRYLDATASLWYCNVGHGRRELAEAAARQMEELAAYYTYATFSTRAAVELCERVSALSPFPQAAVFLTSGGSDSIDTAAKLVRRYWDAVGRPERRMIVVREGAYHGMNAYGTSLCGIPANVDGYGELVAGVVRVPRDDLDALAAVLERHEGEVAAFLSEPVIGAGGVYPPSAGYWEGVQRLCREHDVLLVLDEVVTGFGRMGTWFAAERYGIAPDLVVAAKGITSGYVPLGAVIAGERVREPFFDGRAGMFRHGYTYSGHATACAVALANLDVIEREGLVAHVAELEPEFTRALGALAEHPLVEEVRAEGLVAAVELDRGLAADRAAATERVAVQARGRGVLTRAVVGHSLQISPPFVIGPDDVSFMCDGLTGALDAVAADAKVAS